MKPKYSNKINWNHPLSKGLVLALPLNEGNGLPRDYTNNYIFEEGATGWEWTIRNGVPVIRFTTAAANIQTTTNFTTPACSDSNIVSSIYIRFARESDYATTQWVCGMSSNTGIQVDSTDRFRALWGEDNRPILTTPTAVDDITLYGVGTSTNQIIRFAGSNPTYINGLLETDDIPNSENATAAIRPFALGANDAFTSGLFGFIECCYIWHNRELTAEEHYQIHSDPYQMFQPETRYGFGRVSQELTQASITPTNDIEYVGGAGSAGVSSTAMTITHGLTIYPRDVVVAVLSANNTPTMTDNNGAYTFKEAFQESFTVGGNQHALFYRIAGANEPATYNFTLSTSQVNRIQLKVFRGVDIFKPFDVYPSLVNRAESTTTPRIAPSIKPSIGNTTVIACHVIDASSNTYSDPTNGFGDLEQTSGVCMLHRKFDTDQSTNTMQVTSSSTNNGVSYMFSLRPWEAYTPRTIYIPKDTTLPDIAIVEEDW